MGCSGLSSIKIPNGVTKIDGFTFSKCSGLTSVTIPNSVTQIYVGAFEDCTSLSSITIPKNVVSISEFAFAGCTTLTAIEVDEENVNFSSIDGVLIGASWGGQLVAYPAGKQGAYTIPNNVTYIEQGAFFGCTGLTGVTIPSSVLYIEDEVFIGCSGLKSIQVNTGNPNYASIDGVLFTAAKDELIAYPAGKRGAYTIPDSVTRIWFDAFYGCSGLTSVIIPSSVTCIESLTFYGCTGLTSVIIPSSVTCIESSAFSGCTGLTSVNIPSNVDSIADNTFYGCSGLTSVTIPSSVNKIGSYAFHHCDALTDVYYGGSETQWKAIEIGSFNEKLTNATIHYGTMDPEPGPSGNGVIKSFYPSNGSTFDHASTTGDKAFHITFDRDVKNAGGNRPELDFSVGTLKVHKADDDSVVYQVAESSFTSGTSTSVSLYGSTAPYTAVSITGITPELDYGTEYYVTMPAGFIKFADGTASPAIAKGEWRFTTAEKKEPVAPEIVTPEKIREKFLHYSSEKENGKEKTREYGFSYDDSWFMNSSYTYQHDLAKMSLCVAMAAYGSEINKDNTDRAKNIKDLMGKLHFEFFDEKDKKTVDFPEPSYDSIGYAIGKKNIKSTNPDSEDFTLILVAIRSGNYGIEWGGNFKVGTGVNHEGFDTAAKTVLEKLDSYVESYKEEFLPNVKICITGYSRGAATTNLVAKELDDGFLDDINLSRDDIFAFCFECPQNTRAKNTKDEKYNNIINIVNPNDFVTKVAMSSWGYTRYGRTLYLPYEFNGKEYANQYNRMSGAYYYLTGHEPLLEVPGQSVILDGFMNDLALTLGSPSVYSTLYQSSFVEAGSLLGGGELTWKDIFALKAMLLVAAEHSVSTGQTISLFASGCAQKGHYADLCLAWMNSLSGDLKEFSSLFYRKTFINCPVDVEVLDKDNTVVVRIRNNSVENLVSGVMAYIDDDGQKVVVLPCSEEYTIKMVATDDGAVTYTATEYNMDSGETEKLVSYYQVDVKTDDVLTGLIENLDEVASASYPLYLNDSDESLAQSVNQSGDSVQEFSVVVSNSGNGSVIGGGKYVSGEFAKVTATPNTGETFLGWYVDSNLVSSDAEYRFLVNKDISITAKFTSKSSTSSNPVSSSRPTTGNTGGNSTTTASWRNPFTDVAESAWYYSAVKFVSENGLMNGVGNNLFAPDAKLSRAMLAQILYNREGKPSVNSSSVFSDVATDAWYADAVTWASGKGIVTGYGNGLFGPNDDITREQLVVMLYRYAGSPVTPDSPLNFTDADKVSAWAQDAMRWAVEQGIINGKGNGILDPRGNATRAEAAQMLKNYLGK